VIIIFFIMPPFLMSKSVERAWIEQEPVRPFATVQFSLSTASGHCPGRLRIRPPVEE